MGDNRQGRGAAPSAVASATTGTDRAATGQIEARPDQSIRRPVAGALHMAVRELAPRHRAPDRIEEFLGVLKAFAARDPKAPKGSFTPHLGIDVPAVRGRADSGDLEIDLDNARRLLRLE